MTKKLKTSKIRSRSLKVDVFRKRNQLDCTKKLYSQRPMVHLPWPELVLLWPDNRKQTPGFPIATFPTQDFPVLLFKLTSVIFEWRTAHCTESIAVCKLRTRKRNVQSRRVKEKETYSSQRVKHIAHFTESKKRKRAEQLLPMATANLMRSYSCSTIIASWIMWLTGP